MLDETNTKKLNNKELPLLNRNGRKREQLSEQENPIRPNSISQSY